MNIDARLMALPHKKPAVTETGSIYNTTKTGDVLLQGMLKAVDPKYPSGGGQHKWLRRMQSDGRRSKSKREDKDT